MDTNFHGYPFNLTPLTEEDGGGWLIVFPDFPGAVMSDGETPEEALANGRDALEGVIAIYKEDGRELPVPGNQGSSIYGHRRASTPSWPSKRRSKACP